MSPQPKPRATPHPLSPPRRPQGQPTRGKTASNRLRRVDFFLLKYDPALIRRNDGVFERAFFVDLGYGATPTTTLESFARLRTLNPNLPVLGIEIDPERVTIAQPFREAGLDFRLGGFNIPLGKWADNVQESVRAVRAFNVLRQYEEDAVIPAYARMAEGVLPGGLLIEGTSNPTGQLWVAHIMRRTLAPPNVPEAWVREAVVFSTNFRSGFDPSAFQPVLPKDLIHHMVPGESIYAFFSAWKQAAAMSAHQSVWGARAWFVAAAQQLAQSGYAINLRPQWLRKGFLLWSVEDVGISTQ